MKLSHRLTIDVPVGSRPVEEVRGELDEMVAEVDRRMKAMGFRIWRFRLRSWTEFKAERRTPLRAKLEQWAAENGGNEAWALPAKEIARRSGIPLITVNRVLGALPGRRDLVSQRVRRLARRKQEERTKDWDWSLSDRELAEKLGLTRQRVFQLRKKLGKRGDLKERGPWTKAGRAYYVRKAEEARVKAEYWREMAEKSVEAVAI